MFHRWAALVLVLALCAMTPKYAAGQETQQTPRGHSAGAFGKPYPNPFNPEVFIPFSVDTTACTDGSQQHVVSIRILNILAQQVAIQDRAVEAALHGDRQAALQALLLDPVIQSYEAAVSILDELLAVHAPYLPKFGEKVLTH